MPRATLNLLRLLGPANTREICRSPGCRSQQRAQPRRNRSTRGGPPPPPELVSADANACRRRTSTRSVRQPSDREGYARGPRNRRETPARHLRKRWRSGCSSGWCRDRDQISWMGRTGRPSQALLLRFAAAFPFPAVSVIGHPLDRGLVRGLTNWLVAQRAGPLSAGLIVHVQDLTGERRAHTPDSPESRRPEASTVREGCRHLRAYLEVRHGHLPRRAIRKARGTRRLTEWYKWRPFGRSAIS